MNWLWNLRRAEPPPAPPTWVPVLGRLQKTLRQEDYLPLRPLPMFESDFVQVTSGGAPVYVHHRSNHLTMGVAATLPGSVLPDLLLIAGPPEDGDCPNLSLSRMIPMDLVRLYVHNLPARCLKLRLLTGRYYYLELNAPARELAFLFEHWVRLVALLQEAPCPRGPAPLSTPLSDLVDATPPASTWQLQDQPHRKCWGTATHPPRKAAKASRPRPDRGARGPEPPAGHGRFLSRAVGDSVPLVWSQLQPPGSRRKKFHPVPCEDSLTESSCSDLPMTCREPPVPGRPSVTIRTIFSIFSSSFSTPLSSKRRSAERAACGDLAEAPPRCDSLSSEAALLVSYRRLYRQEALGGLGDPDSDSLSSCSLGLAAYLPAHPGPAGQPPRPPPSQRAPLKHPQKTPADGAPSQKAPAPLKHPQKAPADQGPSQKAPAPLKHPQKAPADQGPSQKARAGPAAPKKTPVAAPAPPEAPASSKAPRVPSAAAPKKSSSAPVLCLEPLSLPTEAPTPRTRYPTMAWDPAAWGPGPAGGRPERTPEPLMLVGTQEAEVVEVRARKMSLELPGHSARTAQEEVVVGRAREVALDGLRGRGQVEDRVRTSREEQRVDLPGLRSQAAGQRWEWVQSQQLAVEGDPGRPVSVEALALARLMLTAEAEAQAQGPPPSGPRPSGALPSWLLLSQGPGGSPRGSRRAPRERPRAGSWMEGGVGLWVQETRSVQAAKVEPEKPLPWTPRGPSRMGAAKVEPQKTPWTPRGPSNLGAAKVEPQKPPPWTPRGPSRMGAAKAEPEKPPWTPRGPSRPGTRAPSTRRSSRVDRVSETPIPLPATKWEDLPPSSPAMTTPISKMEEVRASLRLHRPATAGTEEPGSEERGSRGQGPGDKAGPILEEAVPKLLELERRRAMAGGVQQSQESPQIPTRESPQIPTRESPHVLTQWPRHQALSPASNAAGSQASLHRYMVRSDLAWPGHRRGALYSKNPDAGHAEPGAGQAERGTLGLL